MQHRSTPIGIALAALAALAIFAAMPPSRAGAQDCGCDHVVEPGDTIVNGTEMGIDPGDVVCIMAGDYEFLRFRELAGTAEDPIVITNCGGVVNVENVDRAYCIVFEDDSRHFHFTGTGDPASEYGVRARAPDRKPYPAMGLWMLGRSTDYEIDHVEVSDTGFAGVMAKTDPLCDGSADQGVFVQRNVHLHHLYVHDTGGEAFYVGSTQSSGHTITCNGVEEVHQPHFLEGIEIDHVLVEDTQWDGMQVGMAHTGCSVHDNVIRRVGKAGERYQQQGLQIGTYSRCDVRRNTLEHGPTNGIFVLNAYDTTVSDNVIVDFDGDGIYANLEAIIPSATYRIVHNTIVGSGDYAVQVFGDGLVNSVAWNNLIIGSESDLAAGGDVGWQEEGNVFFDRVGEAQFYGSGDYHLRETSPAIGAGVDHASDGFTLDRASMLRASPPSAGAYEFDASAPIPSASSSGCGCALAGRSADPGASRAGALAWLVTALALTRCARRGRSRGEVACARS